MQYLKYCVDKSDIQTKKYISNYNNKYLYICSIDPGITNFCVRIERRRNRRVKTLLYELININGKYKTIIINFFELYKNIIEKINIVVIESQVFKNTKMINLMSYLETIFRFHIYNVEYCNLDIVKISGIKYTGLNISTKGMVSRKRKTKLSPAVAEEILETYNLHKDIETLHSSNKKDDYSDTVMLIESFLYKYDVNEKYHIKSCFDQFLELGY